MCVCESVVSKPPTGKSLKDEGNLQIYYLYMRDNPHQAFLILLDDVMRCMML